MVTLILPGYSSSNKKWLEETATKIPGDSEIRPVYWGHWDDPSIEFSAKTKANLLDGVVGKRVVDVIAKSLGILAASYLILKAPLKIRKVIFCGIPLNDIKENEKETIKDALRVLSPSNIEIFENDEDPHGNLENIKVFLSEFGEKIIIIPKHRNDHEYFYQEDFGKFLLD